MGVVLGPILVVGLLLSPTSAVALTHPLLGSFCAPGGVGAAPCEPSFTLPEALVVDQGNGDLLVLDAGSFPSIPVTVSRYHADGTPAEFSALGTNVIDGALGEGGKECAEEPSSCDEITPQGHFSQGLPAEVQVAIDESGGATDGNIYVADPRAGLIDIFGEDGSFLGQLTESSEGPFGTSTCGVAVDPSGNVYVGDFQAPVSEEGEVHVFESAGSFPVNGDNSANFAFSEVCTLAAGAGPTAGFIFAAHFRGAVVKLDAATGDEKYPVDAGPATTVTVDPGSGHVFSISGSKVREFDASGATEATLRSSITVPSEVWGAAVNGTSGNVYVARAGKPQIEVWGPAVALPEVLTQGATSVGATSATLNGSVNPGGLELLGQGCFFEYDTAEYHEHEPPHGKIAPCEEPDAEEVGEGNSPVAVHADVLDLEGSTTYHFRLAAENANGRAEGEDGEFQTLGPEIDAELVSEVTATGARISGLINPRGEQTNFFIEYVSDADFTESGYANATPVPATPREVGSGAEFVSVVQQLTGLAPETSYHARIVASSPAFTIRGSDLRFTTFSEASAGLPDNRRYEQVSPSKKVGEVFPPSGGGAISGSCTFCVPGFDKKKMPMQTTDDGEAMVFEGQPFSAGLSAGLNEYLVHRGPEGWRSSGLSRPEFGSTAAFKSFSPNLSHGVIHGGETALSPTAPRLGERAYSNLYLWTDEGLEPLVTVEPPVREAGEEPPDNFAVVFGGANAGVGLVPSFSHLIFAANDALTSSVEGVAPAAPPVSASEDNLYEWFEGELRLVNVLPGNASADPGAVFGSGFLIPSPGSPNYDFANAISRDGSRIFWSDSETGKVYVRTNASETQEIPGPGKFLEASATGDKVLLDSGRLYDLGAATATDLTGGQGGFEGTLGASEDLSHIYFVDNEALTPPSEENENQERAEDGKDNLYGWEEGSTTFIGSLLPNDNQLPGDWRASPSDRTAQVSPDGEYLAFMSAARLTEYDNEAAGKGQCDDAFTRACREVFEYAAASNKLTCVSCNPSGKRPIGKSNLSLIPANHESFEQPNYLSSASGRIVFESQDVLSQEDTNGRIQDVYEWEPQGVGSCQKPVGCVFLISGGTSITDSHFIDATPSGGDIFFDTRERLLPSDIDEYFDVYDARVGGGFPEEGVPPPCGGEACKGSPAGSPTQGSAASSSFVGPGNEKPKAKKHHKHKKKHKRQAKKRAAKHNRGGSK